MLIPAVILNAVDILMIFLLTHAIIKQIPIFTWDRVFIGIGYGVVLGIVAYFFDNYVYRIITTSGAFIVIYLIAKVSFSKALLIYALTWIFGLIQFIIIFGVQQLHLEQPAVLFLVQAITLAIVLIICRFRFLNIIFQFIEKYIVLQLAIFVVGIALIGALFNFNFQESTPYLIYFIGLLTAFIVAVIIIFFPIMQARLITQFKKLNENLSERNENLSERNENLSERNENLSERLVERSSLVHDLKNSLLSTGIAMDQTDDPEELKEMFKKHSKAFGMDLSQLDSTKLEDDLAQMELRNNAIESFIQTKAKEKEKSIKIISDLTYFEDFEGLDLQIVLVWLGILIDNALEASQHAPIYVYLYSGTRRLRLRVDNDYLGKLEEEINNFFEKGYSTKGEGRGIGLHNLYTQVSELGGEIEVDNYYTEFHQCHYFQISILLEKDAELTF